MATCALCSEPVNLDDKATWKQVTGWVGGPKSDSMRLRTDTGKVAHDECVKLISGGQAPDQQDLFKEN